jgi:hypothetical protein
MGCGCTKRKERLAQWASDKGHRRTARLIRRIPTPPWETGDGKDNPRRVLRGTSRDTKE